MEEIFQPAQHTQVIDQRLDDDSNETEEIVEEKIIHMKSRTAAPEESHEIEDQDAQMHDKFNANPDNHMLENSPIMEHNDEDLPFSTPDQDNHMEDDLESSEKLPQ